jgi:ATP synthase protein I
VSRSEGEKQHFQHTISRKVERRLKAEREKDRGVWFGFGMFGLVGWTVAIPSLIGLALGIWIDNRWPSRFSWTIMGLFMGVVIGCIGAWRWVVREGKER